MRRKGLLALISLIAVFSFVQSKCQADTSDKETFRVTIPTHTIVVLQPSSTNFGTISAAEFGTSVPSAHNIIVGDGSGEDSYVQSNDPTAGSKQYLLTFASNGGSTTALADGGTKAVLTLGNSDATASVSINISNTAKSAYPKLGYSTPVAFALLDATRLSIPAGNNVMFFRNSKKAPLDLTLDLDESSMSITDAAGDISFDMTLTVIGL